MEDARPVVGFADTGKALRAAPAHTNSRPALEVSKPPQNAISPKSGYSSHEVFNQSVNV